MRLLNNVVNYVELRKLEYGLRHAESFENWDELARLHDELSGAEAWKQRDDSELFDARQIRKRFKLLKQTLEDGDSEETLFALNEGIHGNMGGMGKSALYRRSKRGTKKLINEYVDMIILALRHVADAPESEIALDEKLDFFRRASHCYGRSALTLSGGSGLIYFHHGVIDTLLEHDLLPNVISGASAGAWVAAQVGTRTNDELKGYFRSKRYDFSIDSWKHVFDLIVGRGRAEIESERDDVIDDFLGNLTFQEAYEHTGRYINIPIAPVERYQTSRLMNAITSPNVTIRSAVKASSSVPGVLDPMELEAKDSRGRIKAYLRGRRWVDGSFAQDLPFKRLSRLFGVNHYIVSMINPLAVPFLYDDTKSKSDTGLGRSVRTLARVGSREALKNTRRWLSPVTLGAFDSLLGAVYRLIDQEYVGDINIRLTRSQMRPRYSLFSYRDESDIHSLISAGSKAVWPKLDQIKNAVAISRVIDELLEKLEQESVTEPHSLHKLHMTM